jgi:hypothetical protein
MVASKSVPNAITQIWALNAVQLPWEVCQNIQKIPTEIILDFCATKQQYGLSKIRTVRPVKLAVLALDFHAKFLLYGHLKICTVWPPESAVPLLDFCACINAVWPGLSSKCMPMIALECVPLAAR